MTSVALLMQKGGSGKTTTATNLAVAAKAAGASVVLVDLDPQGSASTWHAVRQEAMATGHPQFHGDQSQSQSIALEVANAATLARTLSKHRKSLVIIDTPPHNSSLTATVLELVDLAIVPVRPSAFDLAAVSDTADVIKRSRCPMVGSVLNGAIPQSTVGVEVGQALAEAGLPVVGQLHQRVVFQHAAAAGQGVVEYEPRGRAAEEVIALWNALADQLLFREGV